MEAGWIKLHSENIWTYGGNGRRLDKTA